MFPGAALQANTPVSPRRRGDRHEDVCGPPGPAPHGGQGSEPRQPGSPRLAPLPAVSPRSARGEGRAEGGRRGWWLSTAAGGEAGGGSPEKMEARRDRSAEWLHGGCGTAEGRSQLGAEAGASELPPRPAGFNRDTAAASRPILPGLGARRGPSGRPWGGSRTFPALGQGGRRAPPAGCPPAALTALRGAGTAKHVKFSNSVGKTSSFNAALASCSIYPHLLTC